MNQRTIYDRIFTATEVDVMRKRRKYRPVSPPTQDISTEFWLSAYAWYGAAKRYAVPIAFALGLIIGYAARASADDAFPLPTLGSGAAAVTDATAAALADSLKATAAKLAARDRFPVIESDDVFLTAWTAEANMSFFLRNYAGVNQDEAEQTAHVLWEAANNAEYATTADRHLLAWIGCCLSIPEASGRCGGMSGGYHGLLQVGKLHERMMRKMGLSWYSEQDCATYALIKIGKRLNENQSLWTALQPWAQTRGRALRLLGEAGNHGLIIEHEATK